ncbi:MAG TPA: TIM-barrel domain-containing protein [Bryobacteraceae bacterium]|nr:TIM-barrel domain-containing protein [Bryobacteraceae bacterium]
MNRREALRTVATSLVPGIAFAAEEALTVGGKPVVLQIGSVSAYTVRVSISELDGPPVVSDGALVKELWGPALVHIRNTRTHSVKSGKLRVDFSPDPLVVRIASAGGAQVQELKIDKETGGVSFPTGDVPLLALGEGGPQFDRRGSTDRMRSGQGGFQLRTHGGRVPIPLLIGTSGWAIFFHQPQGTFDFTGPESRLLPVAGPLPIDLFVIGSREPSVIMAEYAGLTGYAELPPLWSFGYQQSHRTLASREEILEEARTFREKKLPCDTMIYLGTGFCPSGWNTNNGEFEFNRKVFPDPKAIFDELHQEHFKVALHVVIKARTMHGTVHDACDAGKPVEEQPSCYWAKHHDIFALGVDGWWPDEGDPLDGPSRLTRNRMYWEGPQLDRPNERPFALHRNGYPGMQRYGSFLWSGDVYSTWETLKTHIPIAINSGLSGIPYWGTDIGGFVPTKEFTAELYLRWFQFGAFCPLFRAHGRTWKLRLPWGWNTGDPSPVEVTNYNGAATPDASELHNAQVEPICRKYLELRYRLLPYLYSAVRECTLTGMPILRALWLHYPDDATAAARGDEYLWGRDLLVAPVVEKGATARTVYLPHGVWHDFWTGERHEGGREIVGTVDLETTPLYVRAGGIVPLGPVKQYVEESIDEPVTIQIYPGADGSFLLYEDDGRSFNYRRGEWMGVKLTWKDSARALSLQLAGKMLPPLRRHYVVRIGDKTQAVTFEGRAVTVRM